MYFFRIRRNGTEPIRWRTAEIRLAEINHSGKIYQPPTHTIVWAAVILCLVLDTLPVFVNIRTQYYGTGLAKINCKLLFIYSPNVDEFYRLIFHKHIARSAYGLEIVISVNDNAYRTLRVICILLHL